MPRHRDIYSMDPSPRTVEPTKCLVDPQALGRVLRAMSGRCHECRGGERKSMSGATVKCRTCDGNGVRSEYGLAQIANAAALTVAKTLDALAELERLGHAEAVDANRTSWRLNRGS